MMASLFANIVCLSFPLFGGAQPIEVSLKADFSFSPQPPPFPGSHLSIQFQVPPFSSANFQVESTNAFLFYDVQSVFGIDTTTSTNDIAIVGWFNYQTNSYTGIDIRFTGVFQTGDLLQVICETPLSLFSGSTQSPILEEIELTNLGGSIYYLLSGTNDPIHADLSNGELVQRLAAPVLNISLTNGAVMVSWPSPSIGFNLQVNTNLAATNWVSPPESVTDDGTFKYIIVNPPSGSKFYRLISP